MTDQITNYTEDFTEEVSLKQESPMQSIKSNTNIPLENKPEPNNQNEDLTSNYSLSNAGHPITGMAMFLQFIILFFKYPSYLIMKRIMSSSLSCTLVIMLSSVFDFWITKNISGRLLVGLRWWSQDSMDGKQKWVFECRSKEKENNKVDSSFFWGSQLIATVFWLFFAIVNFFSLDLFWLTVTTYCFIMTGTNLYAYYQCSKEQKAKFQGFMETAGKSIAMNVISRGLDNL